jgi:hypothetical protein
LGGIVKVKVSGAPGFADFEGELLMDVLSVDGRRLAVVGTEVDGKRDFELVPRECVTEADDS